MRTRNAKPTDLEVRSIYLREDLRNQHWLACGRGEAPSSRNPRDSRLVTTFIRTAGGLRIRCRIV